MKCDIPKEHGGRKGEMCIGEGCFLWMKSINKCKIKPCSKNEVDTILKRLEELRGRETAD